MRDQINDLFSFISNHIPFYAKLRLDNWADVPAISKSDIVGHYDGFIRTDIGSLRPTLLSVLQGKTDPKIVSNNQLRLDDGIIVEQTTGTTGVPGRFPKTIAERSVLSARLWHWRKTIDPRVQTSKFREFVHLPFGAKPDPRIYSRDPNMLSAMYAELNANEVSWIHVQPRIIAGHARLLSTHGITCPISTLKFCEMTGERPSDAELQSIKQYFGCEIINQYGCIEVWAIGYKQAESSGFSIINDSVHVELLDADKLTPIIEDNCVGLVCVTSLVNRLLPIVRYINGDRGHWKANNGVRTLELLEDRSNNLLVLNGRLVPGSTTMRIALNIALASYGYTPFDFIQFVQTSEFEIIVRISDSDGSRRFFEKLSFAARSPAFSKVPLKLIYEGLTETALTAERYKKKILFISDMVLPNYTISDELPFG